MNDVLTPDVLFTLRVLGIAFASAWGFRAFRGAKINIKLPKDRESKLLLVAFLGGMAALATLAFLCYVAATHK